MSTATKRLLTPAEYLALERQSQTRHEFYRGEMFAMVGASWEHTLIKDNVERYVRQNGENWLLSEFHDLGQSFRLVSIPVEIPLAEVYSGVTLSEQPIHGKERPS